MIILGVDCGTKTGWALYESETGRIIESGVQDFSKRRGESNGLMFLRFRKWICEMIAIGGVGLIGYERAHFRGGAATEIGVGMQTRVQEAAAERGLEAAPVHTGTLKKFATGKGNSGKRAMVAAAFMFLGRRAVDDNEADAVHIARWTASEYV